MELWLHSFKANQYQIYFEDNSICKAKQFDNIYIQQFFQLYSFWFNILLHKCKTLSEMSNSNLWGSLNRIAGGFPQSTSKNKLESEGISRHNH